MALMARGSHVLMLRLGSKKRTGESPLGDGRGALEISKDENLKPFE